MTFDLPGALRRFDVEAEHASFDTGRYRCRYVRWGRGPALVIVHGLADQARSFAPLMSVLAANFTCYAPELPNGLDDNASLVRYCHDDHVADLLVFLDHLKLDQLGIVGSSFGSTLSIQAMIAAPDRITRGILQGGFACRPLRLHERSMARLVSFAPGRLRGVPCRKRMTDHHDRPAFVDAPDGAYEYFLECSGATPIRAAVRRARMLDRLDLRDRLPLVHQPVLLIGGDRDTLVPKSIEEELLAGLKTARRIEIPRCGHFPQYTHPQQMADAIRTFLQLEPREPVAL